MIPSFLVPEQASGLGRPVIQTLMLSVTFNKHFYLVGSLVTPDRTRCLSSVGSSELSGQKKKQLRIAGGWPEIPPPPPSTP